MLGKTMSMIATLLSDDDGTMNRTKPSCWLEVVTVVSAGGGAGGVLEEAKVDSAALISAVGHKVARDCRAVLVDDLIRRAADVHLEAKLVANVRVRSVCVVGAVGAAGVVVVAVVGVLVAQGGAGAGVLEVLLVALS